MKALNLLPVGNGPTAVFIIGGFVLGVILGWLYAAIRPRFGAGPKTAIIAAGVLWFVASFWPSLGTGLMGFMPMKLLLAGVVCRLAEVIIAALAGAAIYKEA